MSVVGPVDVNSKLVLRPASSPAPSHPAAAAPAGANVLIKDEVDLSKPIAPPNPNSVYLKEAQQAAQNFATLQTLAMNDELGMNDASIVFSDALPELEGRMVPAWCRVDKDKNGTLVFRYNAVPGSEELPGLVHTRFAEAGLAKSEAELRTAEAAFREGADLINLPKGLKEALTKPREKHIGNFLVTYQDGTEVLYPFSRFRFGDEENKGGIRELAMATPQMGQGLGFAMHGKVNIAGLEVQGRRVAGGKADIGAGIVVKSRNAALPVGTEVGAEHFKSDEDQRRAGYAFRKVFGRDEFGRRDRPAPDVNSGPAFMRGFMEAHNELVGWEETGAVTGKAVEKLEDGTTTDPRFGTDFRDQATGRLVAKALIRGMFAAGYDTVKGKTVVIQGSGNVGLWAALELYREGLIVKAINDVKGGILANSPKGIDVEALADYMKEQSVPVKDRTVVGFPGAAVLENPGEILTLKADGVVPAAFGNAITPEIAEKMVASGTDSGERKVVSEGGNNVTPIPAGHVLDEHGIFVVPGNIANDGGVNGSIDEVYQNLGAVEGRRAHTLEESEAFALKHQDIAWKAAEGFVEKYGWTFRQAVHAAMAAEIARAAGYEVEI